MSDEVMPQPVAEVREPRQRPVWLGSAALGLALAMLVVEIVAIVLGSLALFGLATVLGYTVIGLTVIALAGGVVATVYSLERRRGVIAIIVAVVANPLVQIAVLRLFGSS